MADPKKDAKPPKPQPVESLIGIIFVLMLLGALVTRIFSFIDEEPGVSEFFSPSRFGDYFSRQFLPTLLVISYVLCSFFIFGIVWSIMKLREINKEVNEIYKEPVILSEGNLDDEKSRRWDRVVSHLNSLSENDWKFAIIEADIMLGDLLDTLGYRGDTMADKLKAVEPSDFITIESAWEAHKIRNAIAHEGADFVLSEREARRIIDLYRAVFKEFGVI